MTYPRTSEISPFSAEESQPDPRAQALAEQDRRYLWKPFTQMSDYVDEEPLIIQEARGCWLKDTQGRAYLDGVSSLWVNVHGHAHPRIVAAVQKQVARLDHSTLLGPSNGPAIELAARLVALAPGEEHLSRVFYSDSGSTAVEIAVKMAYQFFAQSRKSEDRERTLFLSMSNAYHGDTLGSVSVGGIDLFHEIYAPLLFATQTVPAPDPYHRAFGRSVAEHEDECLEALDRILEVRGREVCALIIEPLVQGAAGMLCHSVGYLREVARRVRGVGALLIVDEVATGFGRTGTLFACEQAEVVPDLLCLAKGLTGGVLPLAATLATEEIYAGFLGDYSDYRSFFHGHSYTGNPIACAAALASIDLFFEENRLEQLQARIRQLADWMDQVAAHPHVGEVRRMGTMTGIELVADQSNGTSFPSERRVANEVALAARSRGVLIRPLGEVVVLMPPLAISADEMDLLCGTVLDAINEVCGAGS